MTFEDCKRSKWEKSWGDEIPLLPPFWGELSGWSPQYMRIILHTKVENTSVKSNGEKKINKKLIINNKKIFFYLNNFYLNYFFTWTASRCLSYYFFSILWLHFVLNTLLVWKLCLKLLFHITQVTHWVLLPPAPTTVSIWHCVMSYVCNVVW